MLAGSPLRKDAAAASRPGSGARYRVMVVDDSAVIRGFITRALESDSEIAVVESAGNGDIAVKRIAKTEVDVVVLDVEMPVMDGLTALPLLLKARPGVKVIMASTLTRKNAAVSIKALAAGASDYVPKPTTTREIHSSQDFRRDLVEKVKALAAPRRRGVRPTTPATVARPAAAAPVAATGPARITFRQPSRFPPEVLAIGSSTGGPQALFKVFQTLGTKIKLPILVTQHMPPTFTSILAEHLARVSGATCTEAKDGEPLLAGHAYIAPGDFHMIAERGAGGTLLRTLKDPPENFCRPAVDPMLRSLAALYGPRVLAVILTGMGHDGLAGGRAVVDAGGTLATQDEATSVVWGMPGAVATAGICSTMLPIDRIAPYILKLIDGSAP